VVNDVSAVTGWRWAPRVRVVLAMGSAVLLAVPIAPRAVALPQGASRENLHRPDANCASCHTADRATLEGNLAEARTLLVADLEERCISCHGNEGPSHHTGIRPVKPVPDTLPLSSEGLITCATCHFVHGEKNSSTAFVRIDNARGGLCLTCHELAELE
jgi:Cytochrome c3